MPYSTRAAHSQLPALYKHFPSNVGPNSMETPFGESLRFTFGGATAPVFFDRAPAVART